MTFPSKLETDRLFVRPWRSDDIDDLYELCSDAAVMRYFAQVYDRGETELFLEKLLDRQIKNGFCFDPVFEKATGAFVGFVGLNKPQLSKPLPFDPCVEIGWRLHKRYWGKGYASEAAREWLRFGFEILKQDEIVAFTIPENIPSQNVMKRIGMSHDPQGDFKHPSLPNDHPMAMHVLYRLTASDWLVSKTHAL